MKEERRLYPRAVTDWPVIIDTGGGLLSGRALDISVGGAFICCQSFFPFRRSGTVHMALFDVPLLEGSLPVRAQVVMTNIHYADNELRPQGMGVRFLDISEVDRELISKLVLSIIEEAA
ncbi:MAG: PilZ domain-containing protein [Deltaproteobacteria bacterium]|nr:MAG: PilZ domain-containing protein [Deltaproteobacteria bacterium]